MKAHYIIRTVTAGDTVEIFKTQSARYGQRGEKRAPPKKPTPEEMEKVNLRRAADRARQLVNENFQNDDYHIILKYFRDTRPQTAEEADKLFRAWLRRVRRELGRLDVEIKYIYSKAAVGERGALHHHIIINAVDLKVLRRQWAQLGTIFVSPLYSDGQYHYLAEYIVNQSRADTHGQRYVASKNLRKPKETVRTVSARTWRAEPKCPDGYYFDADFPLENGVCAVTGYAYQRYGLRRIKAQTKRRQRSGSAQAAAERAERQEVSR